MCEMMERGYRGGQTKYDGVTDRPTNEVHYIIRAPKNSSSCGDLARFAHNNVRFAHILIILLLMIIDIITATTSSNENVCPPPMCKNVCPPNCVWK